MIANRLIQYAGTRLCRTCMTAALLIPIVAPAVSAQSARLAGNWEGVAERRPDSGPPVTLRLKVSFAGDSLRVAVSFPESRLIDLALPSPYSDSSFAVAHGDSLRLEFTPDIGLGFISRLGVSREDERIAFAGVVRGSSLVGTLRITTYRSPIRLRRVSADTLREPRVHFVSPRDSLTLHGKLILPGGPSPHPAVVFVTGSDPDTREAWQVEARALARAGVASLLYDKRGVGESAGANHDLASWDDLAGDVEGAVAFLRHSPAIDRRCIGLIGQSQGTWILAKVTASDPGIRFMANIAGSGVSAAEQETYRTGALMRADSFPPAEIARAQAFQRMKFAVARTGLGWERLDSVMQRLRADSVRWFPGYGTGAATRSLASLRLFGVLQFNYDPTADLERIKVPTLVIMGSEDRTFPPDTVIARMKRAIGRAPNSNVTAHIVRNASHGLASVQTAGGRPFRRAINDEFVRLLTDWVAAQARGCGK